MRNLFLVLGLFFSLQSTSSVAEVTIYAIDIPGLHEKSGGGAYDQIINSAVVKSGQASLTVLPPSRSNKSFEECTNCCLSPANLNPEFYEYGSNVVQSEPMGVAKIHIFSKPGTNSLSSLADLKDKTVGTRHGMPYGKSFEAAKLKTSTARTIAKNIEKLDAGRIDVFVAYIPDAYDTFKEKGLTPYPHAKDKPIAVHPDSLVCKGVSQDFLNAFNASVKK